MTRGVRSIFRKGGLLRCLRRPLLRPFPDQQFIPFGAQLPVDAVYGIAGDIGPDVPRLVRFPAHKGLYGLTGPLGLPGRLFLRKQTAPERRQHSPGARSRASAFSKILMADLLQEWGEYRKRRQKPSSDGLRHLHDTGILLEPSKKTACLCSPLAAYADKNMVSWAAGVCQ